MTLPWPQDQRPRLFEDQHILENGNPFLDPENKNYGKFYVKTSMNLGQLTCRGQLKFN